MKTKEEIYTSLEDQYTSNYKAGLIGGYPPHELAYEAMDEYAKEVAIDFRKWLVGLNKILPYPLAIELNQTEPELLFEKYLIHQNIKPPPEGEVSG